MILPIVAYGDPILKKVAEEVPENFENLKGLVADMFETMYNANGVGLAAPQIGKSIRIFVIDPSPFADDEELSKEEKEELKKGKKAFINPQVVKRNGEDWAFSEGCLSIPGITEDIFRPEEITLTYRDEDFNPHTETFTGLMARVIQHEYDHIEGILFTDKISSLKKRLIKNKLNNIVIGKVSVDYRMRFPKAKKRH